MTQNKNFGLLAYLNPFDPPPPFKIGLNTDLMNDRTGQQQRKFSQRKIPPIGDILRRFISGYLEATKPKINCDQLGKDSEQKKSDFC